MYFFSNTKYIHFGVGRVNFTRQEKIIIIYLSSSANLQKKILDMWCDRASPSFSENQIKHLHKYVLTYHF